MKSRITALVGSLALGGSLLRSATSRATEASVSSACRNAASAAAWVSMER